jgi:hypothetical protein
MPSWGAVLGFQTLGEYFHQPVAEIQNDPLIFFACSECAVTTSKGTVYYLFGIGQYAVKFKVDQGGYIRDNKLITAIALADFVYDHIATATPLSIITNPEITVNQKVYRIPLHLKFVSEQNKSLVKGLLMRNLFVPFKEVLLEFFGKLKSDRVSALIQAGPLTLSATTESFNTLLLPDSMKGHPDKTYTQLTAGLQTLQYQPIAAILPQISADQLREITDRIGRYYDVLKNIQYDPMDLYSLFDNAGNILRIKLPPSKNVISAIAGNKAWILQSAAPRLNETKQWIPEIVRNTRLDADYAARLDKASLPEVIKVEEYDLGDYKGSVQTREEAMPIRQTQNPIVEVVPAPDVPDGDIEILLTYIRDVIMGDFPMPALAEAFERARDKLRKLVLQADYIWELSKWVNKYQRQPQNLGLSPKEKTDMYEMASKWVDKVVAERHERERLEFERLEKERLERERLERERLEQERLEQERIEHERLEKERLERERLEQIRLEQERIERERLEKERLEQERIAREKAERERLERERLEKERLEKERLEKEKAEKERLAKEQWEREQGPEFKKSKIEAEIKRVQADQKTKAQEIKDLKNLEKKLQKDLKEILKQLKKKK